MTYFVLLYLAIVSAELQPPIIAPLSSVTVKRLAFVHAEHTVDHRLTVMKCRLHVSARMHCSKCTFVTLVK